MKNYEYKTVKVKVEYPEYPENVASTANEYVSQGWRTVGMTYISQYRYILLLLEKEIEEEHNNGQETK